MKHIESAQQQQVIEWSMQELGIHKPLRYLYFTTVCRILRITLDNICIVLYNKHIKTSKAQA